MKSLRRDGILYLYLRLARSKLILAGKGLRGVDPTGYVHPTCKVSRDLSASEYVFLGMNCHVGPLVTIGRYSMLAPGVSIVGDDHAWNNAGVPMQFGGRPPQRSTIIGADVWIGQSAIILRGLNVGDGSIIGAGSVVTKDVPPFEVWAGVPARRVQKRFASTDEVERHKAMLAGPATAPKFPQPLAER